MMDSSPLYDEPVHPTTTLKVMDYSRFSKPPNSRTLRPTRYYHIDFGESRQYDPESGPPRREVHRGGDHTVPEFRTQQPYNPFPGDVYCVGNVIRQNFTHVR